jgi:iron complex transport system substrate-binding protein
MKRILFVLLVSMFILSACSSTSTSPEASAPVEQQVIAATMPEPTAPEAAVTEQDEIVITDALGREVVLSKPPTRIVMTGKALVLTLDAAYMFPEAHSKIVAISSATQGAFNFITLIDPDYDTKAILQTDAGAEQIAAIKPDLVILKSYLAETVGKPIEALNIPVVYVDFETPEQYTRDLAILGKIFQNETRAQEMVDFYLNKTEAIQNAVKDVQVKPRVLLLYYSEKDGPVSFNVPPMTWIQTKMVELAGGDPVWADANPGKGWTVVSLEQIAAWDPDHIYIISYQKNSAEIKVELQADPQWQALRAVKDGNLYGFPADTFSWDQSDSRWILGLSWLAARLHPESFPQFDIMAETQQFFQQVYGLDAQFFEEKIRPTFRGDLP